MRNKITILAMAFLFSSAIFAQQKRDTKFIKYESSEKRQLQNAPELIKQELKLSSEDVLMLSKTEIDQLGFTHQEYQQYFEGIKVEFGTYKVHAKNGTIQTMNGDLFEVGKVKTTPSLSNQTAFQKALNFIGAEKYLWESPEEASIMDNYEKPTGELLILPAEVFKGNKARLVYKFDIYAIKPLSRDYIYVDAHSGEIIYKNAIIKHADRYANSRTTKRTTALPTALESMFVTGTAATRYSGSRSIEATLSSGTYRLRETTRGLGIETYDMNLGTNYNNAVDFTDNDNNWTAAEHNNAQKDNAALDAHWGAEKTYDYFSQTFNRNSYNNAGAKIKSYVHFNLVAYGYPNNDNAFWNGSVMTYGDGTSFSPLTSIDIAAHEIGHAVCTNTANLTYSYESGAMNEGFSDIWAACVENFADPTKQIWVLGEEIGGPIRSLSNPNAYGQPDTYQGQNWYSGSGDNGGVHYNSGVLNHWFYILSVGKSGTNDNGDSFNVTGINIQKAASIAYRLESVYLSANSQYSNARTGGIQAAVDLYGAGSAEVIATTNAFYAVGIGAAYVQTCSLGAPANFVGNSITDNGFTLSWNSVSGAANYTVTVGGTTQTVSGTSYTATGLTAGTAYACSVKANCSVGGSGATSTTSVTTTGTAPLNYCTSNGNNVNDEYISRVQLGTINNTSGGSASGYADYTSISTNLTKGSASTITITPTWTGTKYNEGYAVWIDYNKDGDFADSGEQVWTKTASQTTPVSGTFTVPTSAITGATRMRVAMKYNGVPTSCETFSYGEVEDYTVVLGGSAPDTQAPTAPTSLAASGTTQTTTNLSWNASTDNVGVTGYDVLRGTTVIATVTATSYTATGLTASTSYSFSVKAKDAAGNVSGASNVVNVTTATPPDTTAPTVPANLSASGTTQTTTNLSWSAATDNVGVTGYDVYQGSTIVATVTATSRQVSGLTANTAYTFRVRAKDAAGNVSGYSNTLNVTTLPNSSTGCTGGISSFPYSEGFENTLGAWSQGSGDDFNWATRSGTTPSSGTGPSSADQGTYYIYMESSSPNYSNKRAILNSPCFDLSSATQANFTFKYHMYGTTAMGSLAVEASTNNGATWTSVWSKSGNQGNSWLSATVNLNAYLGGNVQLRFNGVTGTTWQGDMAVDNVGLSTSAPSTCDNVSLTIKFDNYPEETSWRVTNASSQVVASGGTYGSQPDGSTATFSVGCLTNGCYTFQILDAYGDGICCSYGSGNYTLTNTSSGVVIASGGSFGSSESTNFCIGSGNALPTNGFVSLENDSYEGIQFNLYPNPVKAELNISLTGARAENYEVLNMIGQIVMKGAYSETVNVSELQGGMYILKLNIGDKNKVKRFIKN